MAPVLTCNPSPSHRTCAVRAAFCRLRGLLDEGRSKEESGRQQLEAWRRAEAGREGEVAALRAQLAESQGDGRALQSEVGLC